MLKFDNDKHEYEIDGIVYPSVTQIIQGSGLSGYSQHNQEAMEAAGKFGTACHVATELWDKGFLDMKTVDDPILPYLEAWKKFRNEFDFTPSAIEWKGYHQKFLIPGTIDRVGLFNDVNSIIDIKTSVQFPKYLGLQTAGYKEIFNSNHTSKKEKVYRRYGVLLKPNGDYLLQECIDKTDWSILLSAKSIYQWKQKNNLLEKN